MWGSGSPQLLHAAMLVTGNNAAVEAPLSPEEEGKYFVL